MFGPFKKREKAKITATSLSVYTTGPVKGGLHSYLCRYDDPLRESSFDAGYWIPRRAHVYLGCHTARVCRLLGIQRPKTGYEYVVEVTVHGPYKMEFEEGDAE